MAMSEHGEAIIGKAKSIPRRSITAHTFGEGQFETTGADAQKGQNPGRNIPKTNFDKRHPQRPLSVGWWASTRVQSWQK